MYSMYSYIILHHFDRTHLIVMPLPHEVIPLLTATHDIPLPVLSGHVLLLEPRFNLHLFGLRWILNDSFCEVLHSLLHAGKSCDLECDRSVGVNAEDMVICELNVVVLGHFALILQFGTLAVLESQNVWHASEVEGSDIVGESQILEWLESFAALFVRTGD